MFLNGYIQTPNIHHFKGFAIKILQYKMKKMLKSHNKGRRTHSIYYEFLRYRRYDGTLNVGTFLSRLLRREVQECKSYIIVHLSTTLVAQLPIVKIREILIS